MTIALDTPRWDLLDFPVSLRPVRTEVDGRTHDVPGYRCVYREDSGQVLDLVSGRYALVPHAAVFRDLDQIVREELPWGVREVRTRVGLDGGYAHVEWTFDKRVEVTAGDAVDLALLARNSLDRSAALSASLSARRLICANGLRGPGPEFRRKWRHRSAEMDRAPVLSWVRGLPERMVPLLDEWRDWNDSVVFSARVREWLEEDPRARRLLGRKARAAVMRRLRARGLDSRGLRVTLWEAHNAVTWWATHEVRSRRPSLQVLREEEVHRLALRLAQHLKGN